MQNRKKCVCNFLTTRRSSEDKVRPKTSAPYCTLTEQNKINILNQFNCNTHFNAQ